MLTSTPSSQQVTLRGIHKRYSPACPRTNFDSSPRLNRPPSICRSSSEVSASAPHKQNVAGTASLNQRTWLNPSHALTAGTTCTEETCRKEPSRVDPETGLGQVRGRQQDFTPVFHHSRWTTPDIELPANSPSPSQFTLWTRDPPANLRFPIRHVLASSLLYGEIGR